MKKSLLSLAVVTMFASSANAAEVYALDGVTVDVSGDVEINYFKSQDKALDPELQVAEGNFGFNLNYEMTEDFSVGGVVDFDANNETDDVTRGDVYLSLNFTNVHTVTFGVQPTILDDAGIGDDFEFGFTSYVDNLDSSGDQVIKYKYDGGEVFYAGIAFSDHKNEDNFTPGDYELDGNIGARLDEVELTLYLVNAEINGEDERAYVLEGRYVLGDINFAATYATSKAENTGEPDTDIDMFGLTASYSRGDRFTYAAGWANIDNSDNSDRINDLYVNVAFDLSDQVQAYAELGFTDEDNTDTGYVVGMSASF
ncbi:porin [Vibrio hannami]|uniref:porin n=1 Tax=Vibrio hannami TaxID=2717094 RepID=UPI0024102751|nr:porin [Vibrio hannami]MDG3088244.1 porin [Vibrio hannami]